MPDDAARLKALEKIRTFGLELPEDWKFDRDEANSRGDNEGASDASKPPTSNPSRRS